MLLFVADCVTSPVWRIKKKKKIIFLIIFQYLIFFDIFFFFFGTLDRRVWFCVWMCTCSFGNIDVDMKNNPHRQNEALRKKVLIMNRGFTPSPFSFHSGELNKNNNNNPKNNNNNSRFKQLPWTSWPKQLTISETHHLSSVCTHCLTLPALRYIYSLFLQWVPVECYVSMSMQGNGGVKKKTITVEFSLCFYRR